MNVAIRKRRSPSASGTSLRIAIANENGTTNSVSAHTGSGTDQPPSPSDCVKCSATPRFTTSDRTAVMLSEASAGYRFSRSGGTEYAVPTASPASTASVSTAPWVSAEHDRQDAADRDDAARRGDRQVAARERQERLVDAVDLDVLELVDADDVDVHAEAGEQRPGEVADPVGEADAGERVDAQHVQPRDARGRADDGVRPGEAPERRGPGRQHGAAGRLHASRRAPSPRVALLQPVTQRERRRERHEERARQRSAGEAQRRAHDARRAPASAGGGSASGDAPAAGLRPLTATAYAPRVAAIPGRRQRPQLDVGEARPAEQLARTAPRSGRASTPPRGAAPAGWRAARGR